MTETVVHVTTLEQWKSVLDIWFKQGYAWPSGDKEYSARIFENGGRFLYLDDYITYGIFNPDSKPYIEYSEFMAQQKEDNKMETYYVTQEQLDLIEYLKNNPYPANAINRLDNKKINIIRSFSRQQDRALLRYLGGDTSVGFSIKEVKEQLYRLWRIDDDGNKVYMLFRFGTPTYRMSSEAAFTAPLEEIKKWQTPAWSLEKVD